MNTTRTNDIAFVTGVGRKNGIGFAICEALAQEGVDIFYTFNYEYDATYYTDHVTEDPKNFAETFKQYGVRSEGVNYNLLIPDAPEELFAIAEKSIGIPTILINNAAFSTHQHLSEVSAELLDIHFAVNVRAATLFCKLFVEKLQGKPGTIINMTSGQSLDVMQGELPYTITKAAIDMLTKQLAPELKEKGIVINAFDPGPTDTGWMSEAFKAQLQATSKSGEVTTPKTVATQVVKLIKDQTGQTGLVIHANR
jgi:3-oxoacyl-[acyl-carrier protein] reductase